MWIPNRSGIWASLQQHEHDVRDDSVIMACVMNYKSIITIESGKRGGRPCIRGMRIAVTDVLGWLAAGMSHEEIMGDFPELPDEDIRACIEYHGPNRG